MTSTGPSIRAVCNVLNRNSCGSGSICGRVNDGSYVLTNAHVAGTDIGRIVTVFVEKLKRRFEATVIRASYSNRISSDWALLFIRGMTEVEPVYLSRSLPGQGESMYTKGYPRCEAHNGTDITQHRTFSNGVLLWLPDAISGQSGSGVWGDDDGLQKALLTWSMQDGRRMYGAGQLTAEIYRQNRAIIRGEPIRGFAKMPGLKELTDDYNLDAFDRTGLDDPTVEEGVFSSPIERGIAEEPIWDDQLEDPDPVDPVDPEPGDWRRKVIKDFTELREHCDDKIKEYQSGDVIEPPEGGGEGDIDDCFGLPPL